MTPMDNSAVTAYWDAVYDNCSRETVVDDDWLDRFSDLLAACETPIIDLGCGSGNDTKYLLEKGKTVIACDQSVWAVEHLRENFPAVHAVKAFDMRDGLPFSVGFTDIVIADLSLHYFSEEETKGILREIKRVLKRDGVLLLRVNSVNDVNHGAGQGEEIEPHFYRTEDGRYKRFFDKLDIEKIFSQWQMLYAAEEELLRYALPKQLWVCALRTPQKTE